MHCAARWPGCGLQSLLPGLCARTDQCTAPRAGRAAFCRVCCPACAHAPTSALRTVRKLRQAFSRVLALKSTCTTAQRPLEISTAWGVVIGWLILLRRKLSPTKGAIGEICKSKIRICYSESWYENSRRRRNVRFMRDLASTKEDLFSKPGIL